MISKFAIDEIEDMQAAGLSPSPAEIVRLNALGLKIESGCDDTIPFYADRRAAKIADVVLMEPTIGHDMYLAMLASRIDLEHGTTDIMIRAWAYAHDASALPSADKADAAAALAWEFVAKHFSQITFSRLAAAVQYVRFGHDSAALEHPVYPDDMPRDQRTADDDDLDDRWNFALGIIHEGEALGLGISLADARRHTVAQLCAIVNHAAALRCAARPGGYAAWTKRRRDQYLGEFYATLEAIKKRHEADDKAKGA